MNKKETHWRKRLEHHRQELDNADHDYGLRNLEHTWQSLCESRQMERGEALASIADNPLAILRYILDFGFYPPPEVLLTISEAYERYLASNGELSLDQVFFGPSIPRVGNHAAQRNKQFLDSFFAFHLMQAEQNGESQTEAAERFIATHSLDVDADTFLRSWRRRWRQKPD